MGATKYEFYSDELINTAELIKAIAHPARLKAILIVANETDQDATFKEISKEIGLSQSTLSVHLKKLCDSGLIKSCTTTIDNRCCVCYRINKPALNHLIDLLEHLISKSDVKNDDRYESFKSFYTKLKSTVGWNQCFEA